MAMDGYLLIDKPATWTSFDVVAKVRNLASQAAGTAKVKVGHAGTLDPFATGLLIVLVGQYTKRQGQFMKLDKSYAAELTLGAVSDTYDSEGIVTAASGQHPSRADIETAVKNFRGAITQVPPPHSAIKVNGKRAYTLARAGRTVELKPRQVTIHDLAIDAYRYPLLQLRATVSSGTYMRSLGHDIGRQLGTGAYLSKLRRLSIGEWSVESAIDIAQLSALNISKQLER